MTPRLRRLLCIAPLALALPDAAAADETNATATEVPQGVQRELQPPDRGIQPEPAGAIVPETPGGWNESPGQLAIDDWHDQNPWGYGTQSMFSLTRGVAESDIPQWSKYVVYPFSGFCDLVQLPFGAVGGLWGN